MNIQDMKLAALADILEKGEEETHGASEVVNFNKTWKMVCSCYRKTDFSFYLWRGYDNGARWHPSQGIDEMAAMCFLMGMGIDG